jgi:hypothetical protein
MVRSALWMGIGIEIAHTRNRRMGRPTRNVRRYASR